MLKFTQWLENKVSLPVTDNRHLIIGCYGVMKQIIPQIREFFADHTLKFQQKNKVNTQVQHEVNPYLAVVWDATNKKAGFGSMNCNVCAKYDTLKRTCDYTGKSISQAHVLDKSSGNCVGLNLLPIFNSGDEMDAGNKKYEGVMFAISKGAVLDYRNGKLSMLYRPGTYSVDPAEDEYNALSPYEKQERDEEGY